MRANTQHHGGEKCVEHFQELLTHANVLMNLIFLISLSRARLKFHFDASLRSLSLACLPVRADESTEEREKREGENNTRENSIKKLKLRKKLNKHQ
jgi:hypothetical protein